MQKFLIVNTKGFSLEQAILAMHENLMKIQANPETSELEIHSVNFVNTFEKPQKSQLDLNGNNQPVIIYNCCITLVARDPSHGERVEQLLNKLSSQLAEMINFDFEGGADPLPDEPGPDQIKQLERFQSLTCEHRNLSPVKHYKAYRNPGQYYQYCTDCNAEVWGGITDEHPAPGAGFNDADNLMTAILPGGPNE